MVPVDDDEFAGDERFSLVGRVGAGGMGVVYRAHDRERGGVVALKTLRAIGPSAIFHLKQEFRALADVTHPNLVALHELVQTGDRCFFTMEYVEGSAFLTRVRGAEVGYPQTSTSAEGPTVAGDATSDSLDGTGLPRSVGGTVLDEARLRASFAQLAIGVAALHQAGKLHRDIKPSNVLVTPAGRVVLLDFGLVTELGPAAAPSEAVVGTAAYMAPEQGAGRPLSEASDWYAAGVMLYEALTGLRPFFGPPVDVLAEKQRRDPVPPREVAPDAPADLAELCVALLDRDPSRRPSGTEILRRLGVAGPGSSARTDDVPLVGRGRELAVLEDAFARTAIRGAGVVLVDGPSGIGKSRLVRGFLEGLRGRALVLQGRCHERESVPFNAADSLIDALCAHLLALQRATASTLSSVDLTALVRVFPALGRLEVAPRGDDLPDGADAPDAPDGVELRRRAFAALRALLGRLAARAPLVLFVDDLQWGDADSAALFAALLAPPSPRLLVLGCHRADDPSSRPVLRALRTPRDGVALVELSLGPLAVDDARALAGRLCAQHPAAADAVAREAGGSPFFLHQLARMVDASTARIADHELGLDGMLRARLASLSDDARRLLAVIALAARPIPQAVATAAAGLPVGDLAELERLRAATLVRTEGAKGRDAVECYHDRIREAAARHVPADQRRALHGQLARALEGDPAHAEALVEHFDEAGEPARAAYWAGIAADRAAAALAFDRAAALYRRALAQGGTGDTHRALSTRLGDALVAAGRGAEAARAYLDAARGAPADVAVTRTHQAAEQLMHSGLIDEGSATLREVTRALGLRAPMTRAGAVASLAVSRVRLLVGGHRFRERPAAEIPAVELRRIDVCWSAMTGFSVTSHLRATAFQARHARLALAAGEPGRVAIAFAGEAFFFAHDAARAQALADRAYQLAERAGDPAVRAMVLLFDGWRSIELGDWGGARDRLAGAEALLRERCTGHAWARGTAQVFTGIALGHQGKLAEQRQHVARILADARARGDFYLEASVPLHLFISDLAADEPGALRGAVRRAIDRGLPREVGIQHWGVVQAEASASLYEGDASAALARVEAIWPALRRSLLLASVAFRREALFVRGRALLAVGGGGRVAEAASIARTLEGDRTGSTRAIGALLAASALAARGQRGAVDAYQRAAIALDAHGMAVLAAVARWRRGELVGGGGGASIVDDARRRLVAAAVQRPERLVALLAPAADVPAKVGMLAQSGGRGDPP